MQVTLQRAEARHDIVLSAGAFASPQILMLSGIGEPRHLEEIGVTPVHPLPGVGRNLQDRYEVGVVSRMKRPWRVLKGISYSRRDRAYRLWRWLRAGQLHQQWHDLCGPLPVARHPDRTGSDLLFAARRLPRISSGLLGQRSSSRTT